MIVVPDKETVPYESLFDWAVMVYEGATHTSILAILRCPEDPLTVNFTDAAEPVQEPLL